MGKGISTAEGRLNLGTEVPYEGSPPLHVEVMTKLDQPNISEPFRQRSTGQNHCAEVLVGLANHTLDCNVHHKSMISTKRIRAVRVRDRLRVQQLRGSSMQS